MAVIEATSQIWDSNFLICFSHDWYIDIDNLVYHDLVCCWFFCFPKKRKKSSQTNNLVIEVQLLIIKFLYF